MLFIRHYVEMDSFEKIAGCIREALNKSPLARRWLYGMGCAKGDDANG
jgi:hypothetical protein